MAESKSAQQVREITDKLEQGIKELFESERFKEYLRTMSKFYHYSFSNTLLIAMQKPEATYVAGYTSWQRNFDRQVMKGEKGIKILAPAPYKAKEEREKIDPSTQKPILDADGKPVTETVEVMRPAFKVVSVFDISQTDGKELPDIIVDELSGSVENYAAFFEALKQESPVPIAFEDIPGGAKGYFSPLESRIAIQEGMSEIQTVKTAIHEKLPMPSSMLSIRTRRQLPRTKRIVIPRRLRPRVWRTPSASVTALRLPITPSAISPVGPQTRKPRS